MTRITERHLIQQVDDQLVFIDEFTAVEVVKPVAEAQIVLDQFTKAAEDDEPLVLANADDDTEWWVLPDSFAAVERALNYFIDNSGVRQARSLDTASFASGEDTPGTE